MSVMSKSGGADRSSLSELRNRRGVAGTWVSVALITLLGMAALVVDVGKLTIAAQRAQDVADSAALAGATRLPNTDAARATALRTVMSNNTEGAGMTSYCSSEDVSFYNPTDAIPDYGDLGPWSYAMTVTARVPVEYGFARVVGRCSTEFNSSFSWQAARPTPRYRARSASCSRPRDARHRGTPCYKATR
jgi:Flp pilus assembly protein TadG